MLDKYFNREVISQMTYKEFKEAFTGNAVLVKYRIDIKDAFKQLGGKMTKQRKAEPKKVYKPKTEEGI